jgi:flagellar basal body-associated protein FliL
VEHVPDEKLKEQEPVLRDAVLGVITRKRFEELHRGGGLQKLKKEIRSTVQPRLRGATLVDVYLDQFAMQ